MVGVGAIGGFVAAGAALRGHAVTLCVRTPFERLLVESVDGPAQAVDAEVLTEPAAAAAVGPVDWVVLATKAHQTPAAAGWLRALTGKDTVVVVLQNGVDHEARVGPFAGPAAVLPGLAYVGAERIEPGRVLHLNGRRLVVPAGELGKRFAGLLDGEWLTVAEEPDFHTARWRKLLGNVGSSALTTLTDRRMEVLAEPAIGGLARGLLTEAVRVGVAEGARLGEADVDVAMRLYLEYFGPAVGTSMLHDRLAGQPLETDAIYGTIVRLAGAYGIDTPLNRAMLALLDALTPPAPPTPPDSRTGTLPAYDRPAT
ncbi:2-dehydropantoate 2-reductase [Flindersiella endophytica]